MEVGCLQGRAGLSTVVDSPAGWSGDEGVAVADDEEGGQGEEPQADDESVQSPAQAGWEACVDPWGYVASPGTQVGSGTRSGWTPNSDTGRVGRHAAGASP